jgi:hypothetical protein
MNVSNININIKKYLFLMIMFLYMFSFASANFDVVLPTQEDPSFVYRGDYFTFEINFTDVNNVSILEGIDILEIIIGNTTVNSTITQDYSLDYIYDISSQIGDPVDLVVYGDAFWVTSNDYNSVFHYNINGSLISSYDLSSDTTDPRGITTLTGTEFWVIDGGGPNPDNIILHYSENFTLLDYINISSYTSEPYGIAYNGTDFYITSDISLNETILHLNSSGHLLDFIDVDDITNQLYGISLFDSTLYWIDGGGPGSDDIIIMQNVNGTITDDFSFEHHTGTPAGISTYNGYQFYIIDTTNNSILYYNKNTTYLSDGLLKFDVILPYNLIGIQNVSVRAMDRTSGLILEDRGLSLNFSEIIPPMTISNLTVASKGRTWILLEWINPTDGDYNYSELFFNNISFANISAPLTSYNISNLTPESNYSFSIRTSDGNRNINYSLLNITVQTSEGIAPNITYVNINNSVLNRDSQVSIVINVSDESQLSTVNGSIFWGFGYDTFEFNDLGGGQYNFTFVDTRLVGNYELTINATDEHGNLISEKINFTILTDSPYQDTYVDSTFNTVSYQSDSYVQVNGLGDIQRTFVQFDLANIPDGVSIKEAQIQLYLSTTSSPLLIDLFNINESWLENITWDTQPNSDSISYNSSIVGTNEQYYTWNASYLLQAWKNNSLDYYGVMLAENPEASSIEKRFNSNNLGTNTPQLLVNFTDIAAPLIKSSYSSTNVVIQGENISLISQIVDNIGVSTVYLNISWDGGSNFLIVNGASNYFYTTLLSNISTLGVYNYTIFANDSQGNFNVSQTNSFTVIPDPAIIIDNISPSNGLVQNITLNITLSANITSIESIDAAYANITYPNNTYLLVDLVNNGGTIYNTTFSPSLFLEGNYAFTISANNTFGNLNTSTQFYFTIRDTIKPIIYSFSPINGSSYNETSPIILSINSSDNINVSNVTTLITYPNSTVILQSLVYNSGTYNNNFSFILGQHGVYNFEFLVYDNEGNSNTTVSETTFNVTESTPPPVTIISPTSGSSFITNSVIEIVILVNDTSAIDTALANLTMPNSTTIILPLQYNGTHYLRNYTSDTQTGNYTITYLVNDTLGHLNNTEESSFNIVSNDTVSPVINAINLSDQYVINGTNITINAEVFDSIGIDSVFAQIYYPNNTIVSIPTLPNIYQTPNLFGNFTVVIFANDTSGNIVTQNISFLVVESINFSLQLDIFSESVNGPTLNITVLNAFNKKTLYVNTSNESIDVILPNIPVDINLEAHFGNNKIKVTFFDFNLSLNNEKLITFSNPDNSDFLVQFGIKTTFNFSIAEIIMPYNFLSVNIPSNLNIHKCEIYNISSDVCSSSFIDFSNSSTQILTDKCFMSNVTSFSGFALSEKIPISSPNSNPSSSGGGSGSGGYYIKSCPENYVLINDTCQIEAGENRNKNTTLNIEVINTTIHNLSVLTLNFSLITENEGTEKIKIKLWIKNSTFEFIHIDEITIPESQKVGYIYSPKININLINDNYTLLVQSTVGNVDFNSTFGPIIILTAKAPNLLITGNVIGNLSNFKLSRFHILIFIFTMIFLLILLQIYYVKK